MPEMIEERAEVPTLAYVRELEARIKALEEKVYAPPVDPYPKDVVNPIVVEEIPPASEEEATGMKIEDIQAPEPAIGTRHQPYLELKSVLVPDDPQPKLPLGGAGLNMD